MKTIADGYIEQGYEKGIIAGRAEGKIEGKAEVKAAVAQMLLSKEFSIKDIIEITGLNRSTISKLIKK